MLQNLQKKHPDSAITAALQKLELDEKARQKKADLQFRTLSKLVHTSTVTFFGTLITAVRCSAGGIFAAKSKAFAAKKSEDGEKGASTSGEKSKQAAPESPAEASTSKADAATGAA